MSTYVIRTEQSNPPIPTNNFDWKAWIDGYEERGSCFGPTEYDAVIALVERILA